MEYIKRNIDSVLLEWMSDENRKPILLRGARQVGKSSTVKHLGNKFKTFVEVNFEKQRDVANIFKRLQDPKQICDALSLFYKIGITAGETLLFFDEIQFCPEAIMSLRFFKEDYPELHVIAAGSLLEFTLNELPSFGVGRIRSLFMYPFSFSEFLRANGYDAWNDAVDAADFDHPLIEPVHNALIEQYRIFTVVGGMPASVHAWVKSHDFEMCAAELEDIQQSFYEDFGKYYRKINPDLLRNTLKSVIAQRGTKFVYSKVAGGFRPEEIRKALGKLSDAGLVKEVKMTAANGLPLGAEINEKFSRFIHLDSGLMLRVLQLDFGTSEPLTEMTITGTSASLVNKGSISESIIGWELVKASNPKFKPDLFYWENISRGATAEVDYVTARDMSVLPIEVKSGTSGKMKSLRQFMEAKHLDVGIRTSLENFSRIDFTNAEGIKKRINILPLYAIRRIKDSNLVL